MRNCCRSLTLAEAAVSTWIERLSQGRPPLPEEPEISKVRESQAPMVLGAEIDTVGDTARFEVAMTTLVVVLALCHADVSQVPVVDWHSAFTTADEYNWTGELTVAQPVALLTNASTTLLLDHAQVEVEAQAKLKSVLQVNCVEVFPRSVFASNEIATYDPSSAKMAALSAGAGSGAMDDNAVMVFALFTYDTSYCLAEVPVVDML